MESSHEMTLRPLLSGGALDARGLSRSVGSMALLAGGDWRAFLVVVGDSGVVELRLCLSGERSFCLASSASSCLTFLSNIALASSLRVRMNLMKSWHRALHASVVDGLRCELGKCVWYDVLASAKRSILWWPMASRNFVMKHACEVLSVRRAWQLSPWLSALSW